MKTYGVDATDITTVRSYTSSVHMTDEGGGTFIYGDREQRLRVLRMWAEAEGVQTDDGGAS